MTNAPQILTIDAWELARSRARIEGQVAIDQLPRLVESLALAEGVLRYRVAGWVDGAGHSGADLHLAATLQLACQRCNGALEFALDRVARFRFIASEEELNRLPVEDDEIDAVVGSQAMNLNEWLEDETILSLPLVPRHETCSVPAQPNDTVAPEARPNPFAELAALTRNGSGNRR